MELLAHPNPHKESKMPTAETFSIYRDDPEWNEFSFQEKNQIRKEWVRRRAIAAGKINDPKYIESQMQDAYADAPWGIPQKPTFTERHPELVAAGETAMMLARTPQQYVANLLGQLGENKTIGEAFLDPITRTHQWMRGEREATKLPGGITADILTDPLSYVGYGIGAKAIPALRNVKAGAEMTRAVKAPGVIKELGEVIPRTFGEFSPVQQEIYRKTLQLGRRFFAPDELKQVAATFANLPEKEAAITLKRLGIMKSGNEARSLLAWAQSPQWKRQPRWWKGKIKPTPSPSATTVPGAEVAATAPEALNKMGPKDYLNTLMQDVTLE